MGLHRTLADHDADPPSVWQVVKVADRCWHLDSYLGGTIGSYTARKAAEAGRRAGPRLAALRRGKGTARAREEAQAGAQSTRRSRAGRLRQLPGRGRAARRHAGGRPAPATHREEKPR